MPGPLVGFGGAGFALGVNPPPASVVITGYDPGTGILSGTAPAGLLVVASANGYLAGAALANSTGQWSITTAGLGGFKVGVAAVPMGSVIYPLQPGIQTFGIAGTFSFAVPSYSKLVAELNGGGGGGFWNDPGAAGGDTTIAAFGLKAGGGGGGNGNGGAGGTASGGDVNTPGSAGTVNTGGASPNGGGTANNGISGSPGNAPGGGGSPKNTTIPGGGGGGYVKKTWLVTDTGAPQPGTSFSLIVGAGGAGGDGDPSGGFGAAGRVRMTWS